MNQSDKLPADSSSRSHVDNPIDADRHEAIATISHSSWHFSSSQRPFVANESALESADPESSPAKILATTGSAGSPSCPSPVRTWIPQPISALRHIPVAPAEVELDSGSERVSEGNLLNTPTTIETPVSRVRGPHQRRFTILGARTGAFSAPTPTPSAPSECPDSPTSDFISMERFSSREQVAAQRQEELAKKSISQLEALLAAVESGELSNRELQYLTGVRTMGKLSRKAATKIIKVILEDARKDVD